MSPGGSHLQSRSQSIFRECTKLHGLTVGEKSSYNTQRRKSLRVRAANNEDFRNGPQALGAGLGIYRVENGHTSNGTDKREGVSEH